MQWCWRRPRPTDELLLPIWFDDLGPVAAAGLTAWDDTWQVDVSAVPSVVDPQVVWAATLEAIAEYPDKTLQLLVFEENELLVGLAIQSGFVMSAELYGT